MADLVDFDATYAEAKGLPSTFTFRFLGQDWELPKSPEAIDMLRVQHIYMTVAEMETKRVAGTLTEADANKVVELSGESELDALLAALIGRDIVDAWLDCGMSYGQLQAVFNYLWRLYNGQDPSVDNLGEAPPPANRGERRARTKSKSSSSNGTSSKRTGSASTTKTSRKH